MTYWFNLSRADREIKAAINKCDICNERLECADNIEDKIVMLEEINDSYLDEYDRHEPRLLFCGYCHQKYMIPSWLDIT